MRRFVSFRFARTSLFSISAAILSVLLPRGSLLANPDVVRFKVLLMPLGVLRLWVLLRGWITGLWLILLMSAY